MTRRVVAIPAVMCLHCCRRGRLVIWRSRVLCRGCQMTPEQVERMRADGWVEVDCDQVRGQP